MQCAGHWNSPERFVMLNPYTTPGVSGKQSRTTRVRHDDRLAILLERAATSLAVDKSAFLRAAIEREAIRVLEAQSSLPCLRRMPSSLLRPLTRPPLRPPRPWMRPGTIGGALFMPIKPKSLRIESFDPSRHDRADFDCGVVRQNNYLKLSAKKEQQDDMTRVSVVVEEGGAACPRLPCDQPWGG